MSGMVSEITGNSTVCSTVCSGVYQNIKTQYPITLMGYCKTSELGVAGPTWGESTGVQDVCGVPPVFRMDSPHKGPVTRKMFPCHDVTMFVCFLKHLGATWFTKLYPLGGQPMETLAARKRVHDQGSNDHAVKFTNTFPYKATSPRCAALRISHVPGTFRVLYLANALTIPTEYFYSQRLTTCWPAAIPNQG